MKGSSSSPCRRLLISPCITSYPYLCLGSTDAPCSHLWGRSLLSPKWRPYSQGPRTLPFQGPRHLRPTVYCPLFTAPCLMVSVYCPLSTAHCILSTITSHSLLSNVYCPLSTGQCLQSIASGPLSPAHCLLPTVKLFTAHCLLPTVHCPLSTG